MKTKNKTFLFYDLPLVLYAAAIFIVSSLPNTSLPDLDFHLQDKLAHLLEFGLLGVLMQRLLFRRFSPRLNCLLISLGLSLFYAAADEFHQLFVPGRMGDVYDFFADAAGILLVHTGGLLYLKRAARRDEKAADGL